MEGSPLWPWLAVAGAGALHGLNPASGWALLALGGRRPLQVLRGLLTMALGHLASVAAVAYLVSQGAGLDRGTVQAGAAVLLPVALVLHLAGCRGERRLPAGALGLGLWSFVTATVQGAGLMLVPALAPLCLAGAPGREITASGSWLLALAVVGLHLGALLATAGVVAWAGHLAWRRWWPAWRAGLPTRPSGSGCRPRP